MGCRDRGPGPQLDAVEPAHCYSDEPEVLVLRGSFPVPLTAELGDPSRSQLSSYEVQLVSGDQVFELPAPDFLGPGRVEARFQPGIPAGVYAVRVTDPWGRTSELPRALDVQFRFVAPPDGGPIDIDPPDAGTVRSPPEPGFSIYGQYGDLAIGVQGSAANFEASASKDSQTPMAELNVSWHFSGPATSVPDSFPWTQWTITKTKSQSLSSGIATVVLAAKDADQDVGYAARAVSVAPRDTEFCFVFSTAIGDDGARDCSNERNSSGTDGLLSLDEAVRIVGTLAGPQTIFIYADPTLPPVTFQGGPLSLDSSLQLVGMPGVIIQRELIIRAIPITLIGLDIAGPGKLTVPAGIGAHLIDSRVRDTSVTVAGDLTAERTRFEQCTGACIVLNDINAELTVSQSTFRGAGTGYAIDALQCAWRTSTVFSVDLMGNAFSGFGTAIRVGSGCIRPTRIVHQTFHGNGVAIEYLGGDQHVLRNNIFTAQQITPVQGCTATSFAARDDHLLYANAQNGCIGSDPRVLGDNPRYVSSATEDFRLRHGSAAIDTAAQLGLDVNGPAPNNFQGMAPDFGACETY